MYYGPERKRIRSEFWNYDRAGHYFVTICCKNKQPYFGEIKNGIMGLNECGLEAHRNFLSIPEHFPGIEIDEFVIMPDHMHGIIVLRRDQTCLIPTEDRSHQKLPIIIGSYKSSVTKNINLIDPNMGFAWQKSYHDRIIRNQEQLNHIRRYIRQNPENWKNFSLSS